MNSIRFACVTFAVTLLGAACGGSTSGDMGSTTPEGGAGASGSAGTGGAAPEGGAQPDGSAGQGAGGGSAGAGAGGAGGGTAGAGAGGGYDAGSACNDCLANNCSKELTACQADQACGCWLDCFDGSNLQQCYGQCGQSQAAIGFISCGGQKCGQTCGGGGQGGAGGGGQGGFGAGGQGGFGAGGGASDGGVSQGCQGCLQQNCSAQLSACQASTTCQCYQACLPGGDYMACYQTCGTPDSATTQLGQCLPKCNGQCP